MQSKKVYFLPRYIASLKYYEKLFPSMEEKGFEPQFLLFEDKGMVAYCAQKNLPVDGRFLRRTSAHIPFVSPIREEWRIIKTFSVFIKNVSPHALVTEQRIPHIVRALFKEARRSGTRTVALQWCQVSEKTTHAQLSVQNYARKLRGRYGGVFVGLVKESYFALLTSLYRVVDMLAGGSLFSYKSFYVEYLGVIDARARTLFLQRGFGEEQIRVVGHADYTLMRQFKTSRGRGRMRILVLSTPFYIGHASVFTNASGQIDYYKKILRTIREVFGAGEAEILFKLHPREENIYGDLEKQGITVLGNEAQIEELVASADLYVAHPLTAANFTAIASGVPALFINFTPLSFLDDGKELYHLRSVIKTLGEFKNQLQIFKEGRLSLQYDSSDVDPESLQKIVALVTGV